MSELPAQIEAASNWEAEIDDIICAFQKKSGRLPFYTVEFY